MNDTLPQKRALKILIVDDNREARSMLKDYLGSNARQFRECEDGAEALAAYQEFRPDWVLMDWDMKRVNGLIATRRILHEFPDAAILMVTNHDDRELRDEAKEAGTKGYVLKDDLLALRSFFQTNCFFA
ncbi:MAG: response regulator transcription factor [Chthoniobacterales bacterium]